MSNSMILLVNCGSLYFKDLCLALDKLEVSYDIIKSDNLPKVDLKNYKGVILSGSPSTLSKLSKEERNNYLSKFSSIKESEIPVLGICHGHQVLGLLFGSEINCGEFIKGSNEIKIHNNSSILNGFDKTAIFKEAHREHITLPDCFELLADSGNCKVECMKHKEKDIFGVQFHPEISEEGLEVFKNFLSIVG